VRHHPLDKETQVAIQRAAVHSEQVAQAVAVQVL
jgi:hypothetical protein